MANVNGTRVLILGVTGMLGHKVYQVFKQTTDIILRGTVRGTPRRLIRYGFYDPDDMVEVDDVCNIREVSHYLDYYRPDVVINCIGVIKQKTASPVSHIYINALFPHQLYEVCRLRGIRLIHISTDCIFSGTKGKYTEDDATDADDIYGKTKCMGEVIGDNTLTLRTCIIGRELCTQYSLLEWFIAQAGGEVDGYKNAIFSGFPTVVFAGILQTIILFHPELSGLYHVSSEPIDKYTLLNMVEDVMGLDILVNKVNKPRIDRSLDSSRFRDATGFKSQSWRDMVADMIRDARQYERWR